MMFKDLDPILHSQLRLAVMSLLISVKQAEFTFLKEKTNSTAGNLSVQVQKLKEAGYIEVIKELVRLSVLRYQIGSFGPTLWNWRRCCAASHAPSRQVDLRGKPRVPPLLRGNPGLNDCHPPWDSQRDWIGRQVGRMQKTRDSPAFAR